MRGFDSCTFLLQTVLLVAEQLAMVILIVMTVAVFARRCRFRVCAAEVLLLTLGAALYAVSQNAAGVGHGPSVFRLDAPWLLLLAAAVGLSALAILLALREFNRRDTITHMSIKEAVDNLPSGLCVFNRAGLPILCNSAMHRFSFAVCGKDVQYITDLDSCLGQFSPGTGARREGDVFILPDGQAWRLEKQAIRDEDGNDYTQFAAIDVTELYRSRMKLEEETAQLRRVQETLRELSANMMAITREEEILTMKMRVHDEMGRCLVAARQALAEGEDAPVPHTAIRAWRRAVGMLKANNGEPEADMLGSLKAACRDIGLEIVTRGSLPKEEETAYLMLCAIRECSTNAVRYAGADRLYVDLREDGSTCSVTIANNGRPPAGEIREGGGLSTLRSRVKRAGGAMSVRSEPRFILNVTLPGRKESLL